MNHELKQACLMDPLVWILSPVTKADFLKHYAQQGFLHIPASQNKDLTQIFNWESLNRILNQFPESSTIRLFADKLNYYYPKNTENLVKIPEQLRQGHTLVLEGIQRFDAHLGALCDAMSHQIAANTAINLYLSQPGYKGYPIHYDTHDFFIFQISGRKHWKIYPCTQSFVVSQPDHLDPSSTAPDESTLLAELTLEPGDILYLPRGFWHQAQAVDQPSLHLTMGLYLQTGLDYLQWLLQQAKENPVFRQGFPWVPRENYPESAAAASPYERHQANLCHQLQNMMQSPMHLHRYHQDSFANFQRHQAFALPGQFISQIQELDAFESFEVRQIPHYFLQIDADTLELVYPKTKLRFALSAYDLLKRIVGQTQFTLSDLKALFPDFSQQDIQSVLLPLVQDGIVVPIQNKGKKNGSIF